MPALSNANSGKITTANTSQPVSAANANQTYWAVHNPNATADLWLGIGNPAAGGPGSIRILPGKTYDSSLVPQLTQAALFLFSGTVGAEFTVFNVAYAASTFSLGGRGSTSAALTPTQALVQSFQGTGLVDALLVFDPAHYSMPGSTPGHLVDALGGDVYYDAPNTQATPTVVQDASGYSYAVSDGMEDMLIASANQTVAWYCAVFRSPPGQTTWASYSGPIDAYSPYANAGKFGYTNSGTTSWVAGPDAVRKDGVALVAPFDMAPITQWMIGSISVNTSAKTVSQLLSIFALQTQFYARLHLAAIAIRYTDPSAAQQSQIEQLLTPMQHALLASA